LSQPLGYLRRRLQADVMPLDRERGAERLERLKRLQRSDTPMIHARLVPPQPCLKRVTVLSEVVQEAGQPRFVGPRPIAGHLTGARANRFQMLDKGMPMAMRAAGSSADPGSLKSCAAWLACGSVTPSATARHRRAGTIL
jgi:hypothetical protein